jgi:uncharacterized protein
MSTPFVDLEAEPAVRGFLDEPAQPNGDAFLLTHGAGANCQSKLLIAMSNALAAAGFTVLRFDLPFRQERRHGPPAFGGAARDRDGIRRAVAVMKEKVRGRVFLGGHSYGGRQASMLLAEDPQLADGLLLLSYPLHPPRKPAELRTSHFSKLRRPALFVHGTRDPFGSVAEMNAALELIPGPHTLLEIDGAGHDLLGKGASSELPARVATEFLAFLASPTRA